MGGASSPGFGYNSSQRLKALPGSKSSLIGSGAGAHASRSTRDHAVTVEPGPGVQATAAELLAGDSASPPVHDPDYMDMRSWMKHSGGAGEDEWGAAGAHNEAKVEVERQDEAAATALERQQLNARRADQQARRAEQEALPVRASPNLTEVDAHKSRADGDDDDDESDGSFDDEFELYDGNDLAL